MNELYLDIETIPAQNPEVITELSALVQPPGSIKKPETVAAWHNGEPPYEGVKAGLLAKLHHETGFDGRLGHVCNIAFAVGESQIVGLSLGPDASPSSERDLLEEFFDGMDALAHDKDRMRTPLVVGFNIRAFDLRFLLHRCAVLDVRPTLPLSRLLNGKHGYDYYDLMLEWAGFRGFVSQDKVARALGLGGKGDMDGSQVYQAWLDGHHDAINEYNMDDVRQARAIYHRLVKAGGM